MVLLVQARRAPPTTDLLPHAHVLRPCLLERLSRAPLGALLQDYKKSCAGTGLSACPTDRKIADTGPFSF